MFDIICETALADSCEVEAKLVPIDSSWDSAEFTSARRLLKVPIKWFTESIISPISFSLFVSIFIVRSEVPDSPFSFLNAADVLLNGFVTICRIINRIIPRLARIATITTGSASFISRDELFASSFRFIPR